jgi:hypothetical protein
MQCTAWETCRCEGAELSVLTDNTTTDNTLQKALPCCKQWCASMHALKIPCSAFLQIRSCVSALASGGADQAHANEDFDTCQHTPAFRVAVVNVLCTRVIQ